MKGIFSDPLIRTYGLPILATLIIGVIWWFLARNKKDKTSTVETPAATTTTRPIHGPIDVRLYDSTNRSIYNTVLDGTIPDEILKTWRSFGRKWLYEAKWVFAINKYQVDTVDKATGEITGSRILYRPVESRMSPTRDNPPSKVHRAITHPEIAMFFNVTEKKTGLQKYMPVLLVVLGIVAVMWMWSQS